MSRPHITLTDAQRDEVETLAAVLNAGQIADFLGFGRTTFFALLNRDEDLAERYKRGKARAIGAVA
jgi:DNA-binding CsgD family transcriptional regulator